ncbi:hypothetical protein BGZ49_000736 [Haplosporangium sp. Z 27]|nr:hypothetical protein BGZ49_000736 [Haplosporangium sp. Z 27]
MNPISNLIHSATGIPMSNVAQEQGLQFQRSTATPGGKAATKSTTMPPEIIQLIVNYLDKRDLVKVVALNWTWAQIIAPILWQDVTFTASSNRIVFLITKSVAPSNYSAQTKPTTITTPATNTNDLVTSQSKDSPLGESSYSLSGNRPIPKRRSSYPWPTLLPYHFMVRSLMVYLSSPGMIQDLLDIIPCCTELRSFSVMSSIPTEAFLSRGVAASAYNDSLDPLNGPSGSSSLELNPQRIHSSTSPTSSHLHSSQHSSRLHHSHRQSLSIDPYNLTTAPSAVLQGEDEDTISVPTTSQSRNLLKLLAYSCPKLEKLWFSGFHPISVLGKPTDLRPSTTRFDGNQVDRSYTGQASTMDFRPPVVGEAIETRSSGSEVNGEPSLNRTFNVSPVPIASAQVQSSIHSLQFVSCTVPPQYLLTMIQYSLPNLKTLSLTQCWQKNPLDESFLVSLAKICPGLRSISLHSTQSHKESVSSAQLLNLLQNMESRDGKKSQDGLEEGKGVEKASITDFPLGTFTSSKYRNSTPSISSTAATIGSSSVSISSSNSSSSFTQQQHQEMTSSHTTLSTASALESISVWFTHSILNEAITSELANRKRHPNLKYVDFGSEESYDIGEDCIRTLRQQRPELKVCTWVTYGDTCEDRDD